jgi:hypothetical protein
MRRKVIMTLLALGTVGGYASGAAHLCHARHWRENARQQIINDVARACVDATNARRNGTAPLAAERDLGGRPAAYPVYYLPPGAYPAYPPPPPPGYPPPPPPPR